MLTSSQKFENIRRAFAESTKALEAGFYFESIWYTYAILQERLQSAAYKICGRRFKEISESTTEILHAIDDGNARAKFTFTKDMIIQCAKWAKKRNEYVHGLVLQDKSVASIQKDTYLIAKEGIELATQVATNAKRLKKHMQKL